MVQTALLDSPVFQLDPVEGFPALSTKIKLRRIHHNETSKDFEHSLSITIKYLNQWWLHSFGKIHSSMFRTGTKPHTCLQDPWHA